MVILPSGTFMLQPYCTSLQLMSLLTVMKSFVLFCQGNDDVYMCVRDGDQVEINAAYVAGRTHPEVATEVLYSVTQHKYPHL